MSIKINCLQCGKVIGVPEAAIGKKVRCPHCQLVTATPMAQQAPTAYPRSASQHSATFETSRPTVHHIVACSCGRKMKVPAGIKGSSVRCPACQAIVPVPMQPSSSAPKVFESRRGASPSISPDDPFLELNDLGPISDSPLAAQTVFRPPIPTDKSIPQTPRTADDALAQAGGFGKSAEERMGDALVQNESRRATIAMGDYFHNRVHLGLILLIFIGPFFIYSGYRTKALTTSLLAEGVRVPGMILSGLEQRGRKGRRSYSFLVTFTTKDNQVIEQSFSVTGSFFSAHAANEGIIDEFVEVCYSPDDIDNAILVGGSSDGSSTIWLGVGLFLIGSLGTGFTIWRQLTSA